jgi:hypothetical protein
MSFNERIDKTVEDVKSHETSQQEKGRLIIHAEGFRIDEDQGYGNEYSGGKAHKIEHLAVPPLGRLTENEKPTLLTRQEVRLAKKTQKMYW